MTKKEKAILKLAQMWAEAKNPSPPMKDLQGRKVQWFTDEYQCWKHRKYCGRALLKILEGRDL